MKIRNGFVSNSSSSSFIIRGIKVKEEDFMKSNNLTPQKYNFDNIYSFVNKNGLKVKSTRFYFDGEETGEIIIGDVFCSPDDGEVIEIPEYTKDNELLLKLSQIGVQGDLKTYMQFIGNDNY